MNVNTEEKAPSQAQDVQVQAVPTQQVQSGHRYCAESIAQQQAQQRQM